jgi:hypothetical protein
MIASAGTLWKLNAIMRMPMADGGWQMVVALMVTMNNLAVGTEFIDIGDWQIQSD